MLEIIKNQAMQIMETAGRSYLSISFPNDFELYYTSLELLKGDDGSTIDFFSFPVTPNAITKRETFSTNIKKTLMGLTILKTTDLIPYQLIIKGTFGKSFKILVGDQYIDFEAAALTRDAERRTEGSMSSTIKTGYGCVKYMQTLLQRSRERDGEDNESRMLFFHNHLLGESYLVEPESVTYEMTLSTNMMWNYILTMTILAPLSAVRDIPEESLSSNITNKVLAVVSQDILNKMTSYF